MSGRIATQSQGPLKSFRQSLTFVHSERKGIERNRPGVESYIYVIYTPNLGLGIVVLGREREYGRFRGSKEGAELRRRE